MILAEIDEEFLENLFYYAPCFDEKQPVSDEEMYYLMQHSIVHKYMNFFDGLSMPTVVEDEDILDAVESEEPGEPDYMILKKDAFHEILEKLQFKTPIDDQFFAENYPYSSRLRFEDDGIHWENPGLGGGFTSWDLEIDNIVRAGGKIEVYYTLTEIDYSQAHIKTERRVSYRTATLGLIGDHYVIERIVERPKSVGGRTIVETVLNYPTNVILSDGTEYVNMYEDIGIWGTTTNVGFHVYFYENSISMNILGSNDYIDLLPVSDAEGVLTCELIESTRPSGGENPARMTFIYDYLHNTVEIKDAGPEFDGIYEVH